MLTYSHRLPLGLKIINDNTVRKTAYASRQETLKFMTALVNHFIRNPDPMVVPIYSFKYIGVNNGMYEYQYDMMRMYLLSKEDKSIIRDYLYKDFVLNKYVNTISNVNPKLNDFINKVCNENRYHDLHNGNIMFDEYSNYRLIDLEGFNNYKDLEDPANNWITR